MHSCPYCETVHLETVYLPIAFQSQNFELAGFQCANCKGKILLLEEVTRFLKALELKNQQQ